MQLAGRAPLVGLARLNVGRLRQLIRKGNSSRTRLPPIAAQGDQKPSSDEPIDDGDDYDDFDEEYVEDFDDHFQTDNGKRTRLATRVITIPRRVDLYFAGNYVRQGLWSFVAMCGGYYSANVVSLSFGALAINDVLAAVLTVVFCEFCAKLYYSAPRKTLRLIFVNAFKIGVIAALIADAFKLQG